MGMRETAEPTAEVGAADRIRTTAGELTRHRGNPCLLFVSGSLVRRDVLTIREALGNMRGDQLDVIVASPGGRSEAAYLVTRELRRRFAHLTAYVPFQAKSAATLLCLAADELVLGDLGELGPLDTQYEEKQKADFPVNTSHLVPGAALRGLQHEVAELYDTLVTRIVKTSGLRPFEAGSKAAELIGGLYAPLLGQVDPTRLADSARGLGVAMAYAERVLQRYRPALYAEQGETLLRRLIQEYPTHGFVLDREELQDLGVPNRPPDATEAPLLDQLALALLEFGTETDQIEVVEPPHQPKTEVRRIRKTTPTPPRMAAPAKTARREHRRQEGEAA
jgi:hypothetical protein